MEVAQYSYWSRCSSLTKQLFKSCTNWKQENWLHFLLSLSFSELTLLAYWKFTHGFHLNSTCWSNRNLTFSWKWYKGSVLFSRLPIWQQPLLCIRHIHNSFIFSLNFFKNMLRPFWFIPLFTFWGLILKCLWLSGVCLPLDFIMSRLYKPCKRIDEEDNEHLAFPRHLLRICIHFSLTATHAQKPRAEIVHDHAVPPSKKTQSKKSKSALGL